MTIGDFYKQGAVQSYALTEKDLVFLHTVNASNNPIIPTREAIKNAQIKSAKLLSPTDAKMQDYIKNINADMGGQFINDDSYILKTIEQIEQTLEYYTSDGPALASAARLPTIAQQYAQQSKIDIKKYETLLKNLRSLYDNISSFQNNPAFYNKLNAIETAIKELENDIKMYNNKDFTNMRVGDGYIHASVWLGRTLKGAYLEAAAVEWFGKRIPQNIEVVNTGAVFGPVFDVITGEIRMTGKQLRTDIMAFDMTKAIENNVQVKYKIGDKNVGPVPLSNFISDIRNNCGNYTISIDGENYAELQQALAFGAQAKAGRGQMMFNAKSTFTTLSSVISKNSRHSFSRAFRILEAAIEKDNKILTTAPMYNAMFNYLLSKHINSIVGTENSLIVTRDGIMTLADYMEREWRKHQRIIQANVKINIKMPDKKIELAHSAKKVI